MLKSTNMIRSGYSLIELIISVSILLLFLGLGITAYGRFNDQRIVDAESKKILGLLESARSKSMTRDIDTQSVSACDPFVGYRLLINTAINQRKYTLLLQCDNAGTISEATVSNTQMNAGLSIQTAPQNVLSITFAEGSGAAESCPGSGCIITIRNTKVGKCKQITVQTSGVIDENDC